ncbi:hypothetical protein [Novipirellula artificiosorum]|uniref:Uncharacterized protein n=1 Tax=Novipirellula artificiosorum TaxID=2528016 RepID=A0A5C6E564_9BACT|nr:hypothetical protein [Novipirellula artificiosorum]TWU42566.1 hypothetical protein Poly41_08630 [Novipirellula artificiosorum]
MSDVTQILKQIEEGNPSWNTKPLQRSRHLLSVHMPGSIRKPRARLCTLGYEPRHTTNLDEVLPMT